MYPITFHPRIVLIAAALALTACGGGGGDSDSSANNHSSGTGDNASNAALAKYVGTWTEIPSECGTDDHVVLASTGRKVWVRNTSIFSQAGGNTLNVEYVDTYYPDEAACQAGNNALGTWTVTGTESFTGSREATLLGEAVTLDDFKTAGGKLTLAASGGGAFTVDAASSVSPTELRVGDLLWPNFKKDKVLGANSASYYAKGDTLYEVDPNTTVLTEYDIVAEYSREQ